MSNPDIQGRHNEEKDKPLSALDLTAASSLAHTANARTWSVKWAEESTGGGYYAMQLKHAAAFAATREK